MQPSDARKMVEVGVVDNLVKHMGLERRGLSHRGLSHRGLDAGRMDQVVDHNPLSPVPARYEGLEFHGNRITLTGWGRH
jgi:hypothetical protein